MMVSLSISPCALSVWQQHYPPMEGPPHGKPCHYFPASFSTSSLDVGLLAASIPAQLLLSESATLGSLSSTSSCTLPEFPDRKPQIFSMVGLGDCLKMFSGEPTKPSKLGGTPDATTGAKVVIAAPTSPRLKFLLKECLSISKWAETSAGWQAPGHIPWESVEETRLTQWIPEGSIVSPENFSLARWKSRGGVGEPPSRPLLLPSSVYSSIVAKGHCAGRDSMDVELDDVMSELKSLRSLFQTPIEGDDDLSEPFLTARLDNLTLPSLVVSNSHCTFPIALESSRSISRFNAVPLAHRRGKNVPPPLVFAEQEKLTELPYPGIPTAFLGSQSPRAPLTEEGKFDNRPILGFEDMINNLRLQCLTMNLQTPPPDESWNSRSAIVAPITLGNAEENSADKKRTSHSGTVTAVQDISQPPVRRPRIQPKAGHPSRSNKSLPRIPVQSKRRNAQISALVGSPKPKPTDLRAPSPSTPAEVINPKSRLAGQGPVSSRVLRSAMVKVQPAGPRSTVKNVRFALTYRDLDKEALSTKSSNGVARKSLREPSERQNLPNEPDTAPRPELTKFNQRSASSLGPRDGPKLAAQSKETPSRNSLPTVKGRESLLIIDTADMKMPDSSDKDKDGFVKQVSSRMSTQSLGRSSLSRIIRGPMFSAWDNRRATISLSAQSRLDENVQRRESLVPSVVEKKSRMPVPLRNIFTRFK